MMPLPLTLLAIAATLTISGARASPSNASNAIDWFPCPDNNGTLCAFFSVPLDYSNPNTNESISLALRMLPATAPANETLGTIITNPGGPGQSGNQFVISLGPQLRAIVQGKYNILSFDPRAVNLTSPGPNCFETPGDAAIFSRDVDQLGYPSDERGNVTDPAASLSIETNWVRKTGAYAVALDRACAMRGDKGILRSSSTPFAVRDMVSILDALGEEKLSYWGFSYGTILGATFAAMFPDRVHRFLDGCATSGPKGCALAGSNSTAKEIGGRIEKLITKIRDSPVPVPISLVGTGTVTSSDVKGQIAADLYNPSVWPDLAEALAYLEKGNGTAMYELVRADNDILSRETDPLDNVFHRYMDNTLVSGIMFRHGYLVLKGSSSEQVAKFIRELAVISPFGGEAFSSNLRTCRRWSHNATQVYRGPWKVEDGLPKPSFPILFMNNTADPVTPLDSARSMARNFGNESASLVIQNGGNGHCTNAQLSLCIIRTARAYFVEGAVTEIGDSLRSGWGPALPTP